MRPGLENDPLLPGPAPSEGSGMASSPSCGKASSATSSLPSDSVGPAPAPRADPLPQTPSAPTPPRPAGGRRRGPEEPGPVAPPPQGDPKRRARPRPRRLLLKCRAEADLRGAPWPLGSAAGTCRGGRARGRSTEASSCRRTGLGTGAAEPSGCSTHADPVGLASGPPWLTKQPPGPLEAQVLMPPPAAAPCGAQRFSSMGRNQDTQLCTRSDTCVAAGARYPHPWASVLSRLLFGPRGPGAVQDLTLWAAAASG